MIAYYNENDPHAAAWLRELIAQRLIADGEVDTRSIEDVLPGDLKGFTQHHFFAGIGGWSYALRLAGWSDDRPVWTGSCPCQPFSTAGARGGFADERHLWPAFYHLVAQCKPATIFGEQVAKALEWVDLVQTDLEACNYTFGKAVLGAHSVAAPHIRQRLYWMAQSNSDNHQSAIGPSSGISKATTIEHGPAVTITGESSGTSSDVLWEWIEGSDGKTRPIEPGTFPLAHGIPARVVRLRGYGNAIVPQVAAMFIKSYMEAVIELQNPLTPMLFGNILR